MYAESLSCVTHKWTRCAGESDALKKFFKARREGSDQPYPTGFTAPPFRAVGHPSTRLDHSSLLERGLKVDRKEWQPSDVGCDGVSVLSHLEYVDLKNCMVVGWGHAALLGVFKDWVNMVVDGDGSPVKVTTVPGRKAKKERLFQLSTDAKRQVTHRAEDVSATCDIGRGHRCPVSKKGNNVMEDWMHLLEWGVLAAFHG
jgi:hypothetical protein